MRGKGVADINNVFAAGAIWRGRNFILSAFVVIPENSGWQESTFHVLAEIKCLFKKTLMTDQVCIMVVRLALSCSGGITGYFLAGKFAR